MVNPIYFYYKNVLDNYQSLKGSFFLKVNNFYLSLYSTTAKANKSANLAKSRPYTWTSSEERKGDFGKGKSVHGSFHRHNHPWRERNACPGMDTQHQRKREITTLCNQRYQNTSCWLKLSWATTENTCINSSPLGFPFLVQCLSLMDSQCSKAVLHPTILTSADFLSSLAMAQYNSCLRV